MANGPKPYNPRSYYVRAPYIPRYGYGRGQAGQPAPGAFEGGQKFGGDIVQGIANIIQQHRMNAVANQILNTQNAPRAGLVAPGVNPQSGQANVIPAGVSTAGTAPAAGGILELAMRNQQAKADLANQQAQLANALKMAQIQDYLAKAQGTGRYAKSDKLTPYQQKVAEWHQKLEEQKQLDAQTKAFQSWQQKNALDASKLAQNFDKTYGKGSAENFYNAVTSGTGVRGNLVNGQFIPDENGEYYTHDADAAQGSPGLFGIGAKPASADQLKGKLIKYDALQSYLDKAKQIEDAGGKLYPTQYPKELYGPAAPRAALVNAAPGAAQTAAATQPADTMGTLGDEALAQEVTDSGSASSSAQLPTPQTQDDYDAIPSGSDFIDVDGIQKTKT
jgi:hypothetical protein